jgi:hypothetical protein
LDPAPQQQYPAAVDHEASGDQLRPRKIDEATFRANLERSAVGQHQPHSHFAPAQCAKSDIVRVLMLDVMVRLDWAIVVGAHRD